VQVEEPMIATPQPALPSPDGPGGAPDAGETWPVGRRDRLPMWGILASLGVAVTGNSVTALAMPFFVYSTTGSAARTGVVSAVGTVPLVLSAFFGSAAIDRVGHRRMMLLSDSLSMVTVATIPLLYAMDRLTFPLLLVLVALGAAFDAPGATARETALPDLARRAGMTLDQANGYWGAVFGASQVVGPPAAGLIIGFASAEAALWVNAGTFAVSIAIILTTIPTLAKPARTGATYAADLIEGLQFVLREPLIRAVIILSAAYMFFLTPLYGVVMPIFFDERYSPRAFGFYGGVGAVGSVLGAFAYGRLSKRYPRRLILLAGLVAFSVELAVISTVPALWVILTVAFLAGLALGSLNPIFNVAITNRTPAELRSRAFGAMFALTFAAAPVGSLVVGPMIGWIGIRETLFVLVIATILCSVGCVLAPVLKLLDEPSPA